MGRRSFCFWKKCNIHTRLLKNATTGGLTSSWSVAAAKELFNKFNLEFTLLQENFVPMRIIQAGLFLAFMAM